MNAVISSPAPHIEFKKISNEELLAQIRTGIDAIQSGLVNQIEQWDSERLSRVFKSEQEYRKALLWLQQYEKILKSRITLKSTATRDHEQKVLENWKCVQLLLSQLKQDESLKDIFEAFYSAKIAEEELIKSNTSLIGFAINTIKDRIPQCTCTFDDLIADGQIILLNAIHNFNPEEEVKFATYATIILIRELSNKHKACAGEFRIPKSSNIKTVNGNGNSMLCSTKNYDLSNLADHRNDYSEMHNISQIQYPFITSAYLVLKLITENFSANASTTFPTLVSALSPNLKVNKDGTSSHELPTMKLIGETMAKKENRGTAFTKEAMRHRINSAIQQINPLLKSASGQCKDKTTGQNEDQNEGVGGKSELLTIETSGIRERVMGIFLSNDENANHKLFGINALPSPQVQCDVLGISLDLLYATRPRLDVPALNISPQELNRLICALSDCISDDVSQILKHASLTEGGQQSNNPYSELFTYLTTLKKESDASWRASAIQHLNQMLRDD